MITNRTEKEEILGNDRKVEVTEGAKEKANSDEGGMLESVFSAAILPETFYRDLLRGHSAKALRLGSN